MNYKALEKKVDNLLSQYDKKRVEDFLERDEKRMITHKIRVIPKEEIEANRSSAYEYLFTDKDFGEI